MRQRPVVRDEGVTKYNCIFHKTEAPAEEAIRTLNQYRNTLFTLGMIGVYPDGIGYGNVSRRADDPRQFWITGTQTGAKPVLDAADYCLVTQYDIQHNTVHCEGLIAASSESMTHAAVYALSPAIGAVIHVHHRPLWLAGRTGLPTTAAEIPYGTPAMAYEMKRLFWDTRLSEEKILLMLGHDEGVISFGKDLSEAFEILKRVAGRFSPNV